MKNKKVISFSAATFAVLALAGCSTQADTVSQNLSKDADSFKVNRQITLHNDITDTYIAQVEGLCALGNSDTKTQTTVICKIGKNKYVKETFRMGDNTTVSSIQTEPLAADPYRYKVIFKPESVIPNIETQTSANK